MDLISSFLSGYGTNYQDIFGKNKKALKDLESAIKFVSKNGELTEEEKANLIKKADSDSNGKVNNKELISFFDVNGDGKLNNKDMLLANKGLNIHNQINETDIKTKENGSQDIYKFGYLQKRIFANGSFRIFERDDNGKLIASKTYRKDGMLYSSETYSDNDHKLFNDLSTKLYETRTFYEKDGKTVLEQRTFSYKENSNGDIVKTVTSDKDPNRSKVVTMDKNKNVKETSYLTTDNNGKVVKKEIDSDNDGSVDKTYDYTYTGNKVSKVIITFKNGKTNTLEYENGYLKKRTYANGRYREYVYDGNKFKSSITYRKDGSKYSEETYTSQSVFNNKNSVYKTRTFFDRNGQITEKRKYDFKLDESNNENIIRTISYDVPKNKTSFTVMDKDKNIKSRSVIITDGPIQRNSKGRITNVLKMENYEDGKLKTTMERSFDENGNPMKVCKYYTYNEDGSYFVRCNSFIATGEDKNYFGHTGANEIEEYDSTGTLKTRTVYSEYTIAKDNDFSPNGKFRNIRLPKRKTVYTYDKQGNEVDITREVYTYDLANGTKHVDVKKGERNEEGNIKFKKIDERDEPIRRNHNEKGVTAEDIINKAKEYLGYNSKNGARYLFGTDEAWCTEFSTYIYGEVGIDLTDSLSKQWCSKIYDLAVKEERFTDTSSVTSQEMANKLSGQFIIFGQDDENDSSKVVTKHIGIVEKVEYNSDGTMTIYTIEGNTGDEVRERKYKVDKDGAIINGMGERQDGRYIIGFADFITE